MRDGLTPPDAATRRARALRSLARDRWASGDHAAALADYRRAAELADHDAEALADYGCALMWVGQVALAAPYLQRALEARPGFEPALSALAPALDALGRGPEAAQIYRELASVCDDPAAKSMARARALEAEGELEAAIIELETLEAAEPEAARVLVLLGQLRLRRGDFALAESCFRSALARESVAFNGIVQSRRMQAADRALIEAFDARAATDPQSPDRAGLFFALGKAWDDLGEPARAIVRFETANALAGLCSPLDRQALARVRERTTGIWTRDRLDALSRQAAGADDLPVLVVGMPRSGTTLVAQILSSHPQVAGGGELSFWSRQVTTWREAAPEAVEPSPAEKLARLLGPRPARSAAEFIAMASAAAPAPPVRETSPQALTEAAQAYLALLRRLGPGASRVLDKSPMNFENLGVICAALPGARIIHCRRSAIDTCLSNYFTNHRARIAWSREDLVFQYRQYEALMAHWRIALPPGRMLEIDYEALVHDPAGEARRLVAFIGLEWSDACLAPEANRRPVRTASLWQARQPVYTASVARWRRYEPWLGALAELAPS